MVDFVHAIPVYRSTLIVPIFFSLLLLLLSPSSSLVICALCHCPWCSCVSVNDLSMRVFTSLRTYDDNDDDTVAHMHNAVYPTHPCTVVDYYILISRSGCGCCYFFSLEPISLCIRYIQNHCQRSFC